MLTELSDSELSFSLLSLSIQTDLSDPEELVPLVIFVVVTFETVIAVVETAIGAERERTNEDDDPDIELEEDKETAFLLSDAETPKSITLA